MELRLCLAKDLGPHSHTHLSQNLNLVHSDVRAPECPALGRALLAERGGAPPAWEQGEKRASVHRALPLLGILISELGLEVEGSSSST